MYIENQLELYESVVEFYERPEYWRKILGSAPRYFVHTKKNGQHYFAMSKFCVIKDVKAKNYIEVYRYKTEGNNSQRIISDKIRKEWIPRNLVSDSIGNAFDKWMREFFPNYSTENANFISIKIKNDYSRKLREVTPEELQEQLELQKKIGNVGEFIALEYEIKRLKAIGIQNPKKYIKHIAQYSVASGFDILTSTKDEERFIEVKSSLSQKNGFFLSENEVETLQRIGNNAYLYLVKIDDLANKIGYIHTVIQNPISELKKKNLLKPIAYKVNLNTKKN